jgi:hypothetical protein
VRGDRSPCAPLAGGLGKTRTCGLNAAGRLGLQRAAIKLEGQLLLRSVGRRLAARPPRPRYRPGRATDARGELVFEQACRMGLEGIVSKRLSAPYRSGPLRDWIKVKIRTARR